jgi:hypothetical protein
MISRFLLYLTLAACCELTAFSQEKSSKEKKEEKKLAVQQHP